MAEQKSPTKFQPLYLQVKNHLTQLIIDGRWQPGSPLPSENQLAAELEVSQGTVRKALDEMTAEKILVRRQGRGTFVAEHPQEQDLFHFFRLAHSNGIQATPASTVYKTEQTAPNPREAELLQLNKSEQVTRIYRVRSLDGKDVVLEEIVLACALFPEIEQIEPMPNALYNLYQTRYGLSVLRANESLKAITADADTAKLLTVAKGTPLLQIERLAYTIDGRPIELRYSRCLTEGYSYQVKLS